MITLHQLDLNAELSSYMGRCLMEGNALGKRTAEKFNLEEASVYAALPADFDMSRLPRCNQGGIATVKELGPQRLKVENEEYLEPLVADIKGYLRTAGNIVVFEDSLRKPNDLFIRTNPDHLTIIAENQELYYCLTSGAAEDKILSTIKRASGTNSVEYVGFFTQTSSALDALNQLELLADKVSAIVFGAFDRESYLLWRK